MSSAMNEKDLEQLKAQVTQLAKGMNSEADLGDLTQQLVKMTVEATLGAALYEHLGYGKHDPAGRGSGNSRNGKTRLTQMDSQILALYGKDLSTREIVEAFKDMYGADASAALTSKVTDSVLELVVDWQSRPIDLVYPSVYLDCVP